MNTQSVDCRRVPYPLPADHKVQPGDFSWSPETLKDGSRYLYISLPGESSMHAIKVMRSDPGVERVWGWDGNEDKPTLTPSIHSPGVWHGYLRNGRLESC